jgi:hypothetical protein
LQATNAFELTQLESAGAEKLPLLLAVVVELPLEPFEESLKGPFEGFNEEPGDDPLLSEDDRDSEPEVVESLVAPVDCDVDEVDEG